MVVSEQLHTLFRFGPLEGAIFRDCTHIRVPLIAVLGYLEKRWD